MDEPADEVAAFGESADRVVSGTLSQAVDSLRGDGSAAPEPGPRLVAQSNGARHPPSMSNATQDGNAPIPQRQQLGSSDCSLDCTTMHHLRFLTPAAVVCGAGKRKRRAWKVNTWLSDLAKTWDDSTLNNSDVAAMRLLVPRTLSAVALLSSSHFYLPVDRSTKLPKTCQTRDSPKPQKQSCWIST